ncbi:MAG: hypothetical protein WCW35_12355 [Bacteroidota bacterium]
MKTQKSKSSGSNNWLGTNSQHSFINTISKRSNAMKNAIAILIFVLVSSLAFGQGTFKNNGTLINTSTLNAGTFQNYRTAPGTVYNSSTIHTTSNYVNSNGTLNGLTFNQDVTNTTGGTINVDGSYTNSTGFTYNSKAASLIRIGSALTNTTAANFSTDTGAVDYKAAAVQSVSATIKSNTYGALTLSGGGDFAKTLAGSVTVEGLVTIAASTQFAVGASNTLTVNATSPFSNSGTFTADAASATVVYNNTSDQDVTGANYYNLTIANGGTKTVNTGAATVAIAASGTLTNGTGIFDLAANALTTDATSTITNGGTIQTGGAVTFGAEHTIAGTFIYNRATTTQSLGAASYTNLTLANGTGATGQKNFPAGTVTVTGTYTTGGADRSYGSGTFVYGSTAAQNVLGGAAEPYNNVTISGSADTSTHKTVTVGNLTVANNLSISANNTLDFGSFTTAGALAGTIDNSGKTMWASSNTYIGGTGATELYGSGASSLVNGAYGSLLFTGAGTLSLAGATTTATYTLVSSNLTVSGTGVLTVTGDFDNDGIVTNQGTITVQ